MTVSAFCLFSLALCALSGRDATESEIQDRLVGTWKLVSTEETLRDGTTRPFPSFGPHAEGFLIYHPNGYMCALLVNHDRTTAADPSHRRPEKPAAFAYSGRYEIDGKREQIVHLPEIATKPEYVGSRQVRPYRFEGSRLILSDVEREDPSVARWQIVWEKVK
ncbi:MAG TPA: lipocalin-like domain-containing protein [Verrucomicrobiae bacterium]|nr:lipocalin-like domain-containing protein [Verrucomicrobiae bacterium]